MFIEDPFDKLDNTARSLGAGGLAPTVAGYLRHILKQSAAVLRHVPQRDLSVTPGACNCGYVASSCIHTSSSSSSSGAISSSSETSSSSSAGCQLHLAVAFVRIFGPEGLFSLGANSAGSLLGLQHVDFHQLKTNWVVLEWQRRQRFGMGSSSKAKAENFRAVLRTLMGPGTGMEGPLCTREWKLWKQ